MKYIKSRCLVGFVEVKHKDSLFFPIKGLLQFK